MKKISLNTNLLPILNVDTYWSNTFVQDYDISLEETDALIQDIAPKYLKELICSCIPSAEVYVTGVYHPGQYNYGGDELDFEVAIEDKAFDEFKQAVVNDELFDGFLQSTYKSSDGYINNMPESIEEFNEAQEDYQLAQMLMFKIPADNIVANQEQYDAELYDAVTSNYELNDIDNEDENLEEAKPVISQGEDSLDTTELIQVYQMRSGEGNHGFIFQSLDFQDDNSLARDNYDNVANIHMDVPEGEDVNNTLDDVFAYGNSDDFHDKYTARSISVSDIIKYRDRYYFVDSFGFEDITDRLSNAWFKKTEDCTQASNVDGGKISIFGEKEKKLNEDAYDEYIENEKGLAKDYKDRLLNNITPEIRNAFNDLKDILTNEDKDTEVNGFYFPNKAIEIVKMANGDGQYHLNANMDLNVSDILNMVDDNETIESAIDELFDDYKADSAFSWGDNFINILSKMDFDVHEDANREEIIREIKAVIDGLPYIDDDDAFNLKDNITDDIIDTIVDTVIEDNIDIYMPDFDEKVVDIITNYIENNLNESKKITESEDKPIVIRFWETEEDRNQGNPSEYGSRYSVDEVKEAIHTAQRIIDFNSYACVEVYNDDTDELLLYWSDGIDEEYFNILNEAKEVKTEASKNIETKKVKIGSHDVEIEVEDGNHIRKIWWNYNNNNSSTGFNYDEDQDKFVAFEGENFLRPRQSKQLLDIIHKIISNKGTKKEEAKPINFEFSKYKGIMEPDGNVTYNIGTSKNNAGHKFHYDEIDDTPFPHTNDQIVKMYLKNNILKNESFKDWGVTPDNDLYVKMIGEIAKALDISQNEVQKEADAIKFRYNGKVYFAEPVSQSQIDVFDDNHEQIGWGVIPEKLKGEVFTEYTDNDYIYELVGGEYAGEYTRAEAEKLPIREPELTDDLSDVRAEGGFVHRKELDNQLQFRGYLGPMWNGIHDDGPHIRYETQEVYDMMSESKSLKESLRSDTKEAIDLAINEIDNLNNDDPEEFKNKYKTYDALVQGVYDLFIQDAPEGFGRHIDGESEITTATTFAGKDAITEEIKNQLADWGYTEEYFSGKKEEAKSEEENNGEYELVGVYTDEHGMEKKDIIKIFKDKADVDKYMDENEEELKSKNYDKIILENKSIKQEAKSGEETEADVIADTKAIADEACRKMKNGTDDYFIYNDDINIYLHRNEDGTFNIEFSFIVIHYVDTGLDNIAPEDLAHILARLIKVLYYDADIKLTEAKFKDKVKAIKRSLKKNDKRLSDETAQASAERIAGSMIKNERVFLNSNKANLNEAEESNTGMTFGEFKAKAKEIYNNVFPNSACTINLGALGKDTFFITWYLAGSQEEFPNGISQNDLFHILFYVDDADKHGKYGVERTELTDDTVLPSTLVMELPNGASIFTKPDNQYMAYGSVSLPFRKTTGSPEKILATLDKYANKLHDKTVELLDNDMIPDNRVELVRSKV